ncbi:MAG: MMPL family transporter [Candidatus Woesearchaeota archaeon]|jgi:predicted RND superfamily exporter protein|nr:MMPL family transporter [Candidatus Woesearchaeota archaeon]
MIKEILEKIAEFQYKFPFILLAIVIISTILIGLGVPNLQVESDFDKENPRHLPAYVLTDRISDEFGGENTVVLVFEVDESDENELLDLRDPDFVTFLQELETSLKKDSRVIQTSSLGTAMMSHPPESRDDIVKFLDMVPALKGLFSENYRMTILTITTNIGGAYEDVVPFEEMLLDKMSAVGQPGGVKYTMTGGPAFGKTIRETVFSDTLKTFSMAAVGIFLLLLFTEKSFAKAIIVFTPLLFALVWAAGIIGHIGLKMSIASVALASIILGLGVEYGVFMLTRYNEERFKNKKTQLKAIEATVSNIGMALLSSGTTTFAGFLALTFSFTPMMQKLGLTLAIGILASIVAAIIVTPLMIILYENIEIKSLNKNAKKQIAKRDFYNQTGGMN